MSYTNSWSNTIPLGSSAANLIDDDIRQVRLDIYERINTILGSNGAMTADPVMPVGQDLTTVYKLVATPNTVLTAKTQPIDADVISIADSAASFAVKKSTRLQFLTGAQHIGPIGKVIDLGNIGSGSHTLDVSAGSFFKATITGGTCTISVTGIPGSGLFTGAIFRIVNGGAVTVVFSGIAFPNGVAPTLSSSGVDMIALLPHDAAAVEGFLIGNAFA